MRWRDIMRTAIEAACQARRLDLLCIYQDVAGGGSLSVPSWHRR